MSILELELEFAYALAPCRKVGATNGNHHAIFWMVKIMGLMGNDAPQLFKWISTPETRADERRRLRSHRLFRRNDGLFRLKLNDIA